MSFHIVSTPSTSQSTNFFFEKSAFESGLPFFDKSAFRLYKAPKHYTKSPNIILHIFKEISKSQNTMKSTFHKCVLNVNAGPHPTPMSNLGKYHGKYTFVRNRVIWEGGRNWWPQLGMKGRAPARFGHQTWVSASCSFIVFLLFEQPVRLRCSACDPS